MTIATLYQQYCKHYLVDTDTRKIRKNTLFFALKGANFNGNAYAEEALAKGALLSIVDEPQYQTHDNIILVDDVLKTLQDLAQYHRKQLSAPIIGLTGSNGKTTSKELIVSVLSQQYTVTATQGNLNNHIGVPLTLLSMTPETEIGVVEMGANHQKEIEFLSGLASPDYGFITNFGKAHLEGFGGVEGVIKGKSELYTQLRNTGKTVFVNAQDEKQVALTEGMQQVFYNTGELKLTHTQPFLSLEYKEQPIASQLVGSDNFSNIAIALAFGTYFKVPISACIKAIESYTPQNNRSQIVKTTQNTILLDAYNANPSSMKAALVNFELVESDTKTIILGDMFELGETSTAEHQYILELAEQSSAQQVFVVGAHFYNTTPTKAVQFKQFDELAAYLKDTPLKQQYILLKGSRGMGLERLLPLLK